MPPLSKSWETRAANYDVIVVGSGYGGGVTASRLARVGKRVAVLERGREVVTGDFPSRFSDLNSEMRVSGSGRTVGSASALYDIRLGKDMHVIVGCGLGGGSLVNGGVALRPDDRVFEDPIWPDLVRNDERLDIGFERACSWIRPACHTDATAMPKYQAFRTAAEKSGHKVVDTPLAVTFEDTINPADVAQSACTLCGDCCAGCNVGAKNTVAMTYLPDAARHGAEIFTEVTVHHIEKQKDGRWSVFTCPTSNKSATDAFERMSADIVVLSAGTLGSTEILLRSSKVGLTCSDQLGQRFSANGDIIAFGYGAHQAVHAVGVGHPAKFTEHTVGAVVSGHVEITDTDRLENGLCIEEGVIPSALAPVLPVVFLPNGRLLGALSSLINGIYKGPFAHLQTFFAVSHDTARGRLTLEDNRIALQWPNAKDEPVYKRLDAAMSEIVEQAGGTYIKNPLSKTVAGHNPATAHPLGGCVMSEDASGGVVNHKSQVFDTSSGHATTEVHDGLYVIDGSIIPRSLGVNPLLTITALSERALLYLAHDYQLDEEAGLS